MTVAYTCCVATATLSVVLLPWVGGLLAFVGLLLSTLAPTPVTGLVLAGVGIVLTVLGVWTRQRETMATVRAGAWPALFLGDQRPGDHNAFLEAVTALHGDGTGPSFDVVGGGWTSWMNRTGATRPRLFTNRFHGFDEERRLWRCGSTIYEMEAYYKQRGRAKAAFPKFPQSGLAFPTYPTNGTIALGSWMACENHGNSGDRTGPSHVPFSKVILIERATRAEKIFDCAPGQPDPVPAARQWMQEHKDRWVVMYAQLDESKLFPIDDASTWLQYRMLEIRTPKDAAEWIKPGAALRWLFVGSGRKYGIGVRMEPLGKQPLPTHRAFPLCCVERPHREPHFCSTTCRYFQSDPCSFVCGWHEPAKNWNGVADRLAANYWYPEMWWPSVTFGGVALGIHNFELIFLPPNGWLTGSWLDGVLRDLIALFQIHRGRCEVRSSNSSATSWVFLDCGISQKWFGPQIYGEPYRILYEHGVRQVANHTGKFWVPSQYLQGTTSAAYQAGGGAPTWHMDRVLAYKLGTTTSLLDVGV